MAPALPAVLGNGVGGVVRAVGDGVAATTIGRLVVSSLRGTGGYAERAVAPADPDPGQDAARDALTPICWTLGPWIPSCPLPDHP
ncbi:MAG TPA: hypothetical protein VHT75_17690 [Acidimicrobiales bacterium]|nr:hypothetical protein [Acidimicrobiales bacterium]